MLLLLVREPFYIHVMPDGVERPVAFGSRTLSTSEKKYAKGLIFAVKKFHPYLYGRKFTLLTDHKPLTTILGPKNAVPALVAARLQRWVLLLSTYLYGIQYQSSDKHSNTNGLSHLSPLLSISHRFKLYLSILLTFRERPEEARSSARSYSTLGRISLPLCLMSSSLFIVKKHKLTVEQNCLLWGTRVIIPKSLRATILEELHRIILVLLE